MKKHTFNGEQLTTPQIRLQVPCLSLSQIREHLAAGRNTKDAMLNHRQVYAKPGRASQFSIGKSPGFARDAVSKMR